MSNITIYWFIKPFRLDRHCQDRKSAIEILKKKKKFFVVVLFNFTFFQRANHLSPVMSHICDIFAAIFPRHLPFSGI